MSMVSQFVHNQREARLHAVYRILYYLNANHGKGIPVKRNTRLVLEAYIDATYAGLLVDRCYYGLLYFS